MPKQACMELSMNPTKRRLLILLLISTTITLTVLIYTYCSQNNETRAIPSTDLLSLRQLIKRDYLNKGYTSKELLSIDPLCGLVNISGVCYLNSTIQCLFSNRYFAHYILMTDFFLKQQISLLFQKMLFTMLTHELVDLTPYIRMLQKHNELRNVVYFNGGDPVVLIERLLYALNTESQDLNTTGSPNQFMITETKYFNCTKCFSRNIVKNNSFIYNCDFNPDLKKAVDYKLKKQENANLFMDFRCEACKEYISVEDSEKFLYRINMPKFLIVKNDRLQSTNSKTLLLGASSPVLPTIEVQNITYDLYAVVLVPLVNKTLHNYVIVRKGNNWVTINDERVTRKNTLESKPIVRENWMFFYQQRVEKE